MDGQFDGLDPAHLAGADADRRALMRQHDCIRPHVLGDRPCELEVFPRRVVGRPRGYDPRLTQGVAGVIGGLHQEPAGNRARVQP